MIILPLKMLFKSNDEYCNTNHSYIKLMEFLYHFRTFVRHSSIFYNIHILTMSDTLHMTVQTLFLSKTYITRCTMEIFQSFMHVFDVSEVVSSMLCNKFASITLIL